MSLLLKGGISRLSELEIDSDKDWQGKGINNIKQVAAGMAIGDIIQHNGAILESFTPGAANLVLTSQGAGNKLSWAPGGTYFERFLPVTIDVGHTEGLWIPDKITELTAPLGASSYRAWDDAPGDYIKLLAPGIGLGRSTGLFTPDKTHGKTAVVAANVGLKTIIEGAIADDGGVQADETGAAQSSTTDDMTLLPAIPAVNDAYYLGHSQKFDLAWLVIGTSGNGTWLVSWEYWNGVTWAALADVDDNTDSFRAVTGLHYVSFTRPLDWATTTVGAVANLYWIRGRVSSYTSIVSQPKGTQAWVELNL